MNIHQIKIQNTPLRDIPYFNYFRNTLGFSKLLNDLGVKIESYETLQNRIDNTKDNQLRSVLVLLVEAQKLIELGQFQEVENILFKAISLSSNYQILCAEIYLTLSNLFFLNSRFTEALSLTSKAGLIFLAQGEIKNYLSSQFNLYLILLHSKQSQQAEKQLENMIQKTLEFKNIHFLALIECAKGIEDLNCGRLDRSQTKLFRSLRVLKHSSNTNDLLMVYYNLARLFLKKGKKKLFIVIKNKLSSLIEEKKITYFENELKLLEVDYNIFSRNFTHAREIINSIEIYKIYNKESYQYLNVYLNIWTQSQRENQQLITQIRSNANGFQYLSVSQKKYFEGLIYLLSNRNFEAKKLFTEGFLLGFSNKSFCDQINHIEGLICVHIGLQDIKSLDQSIVEYQKILNSSGIKMREHFILLLQSTKGIENSNDLLKTFYIQDNDKDKTLKNFYLYFSEIFERVRFLNYKRERRSIIYSLIKNQISIEGLLKKEFNANNEDKLVEILLNTNQFQSNFENLYSYLKFQEDDSTKLYSLVSNVNHYYFRKGLNQALLVIEFEKVKINSNFRIIIDSEVSNKIS